MAGAVGGAAQLEVAAALQHPVEDGLGKIGVVQDPAPGMQRLVGREDHGAVMEVALVDDVEEHVRRVGAVAQVPDLVDHEDVGMRVGRQDVAEPALAGGGGQLVDEGGRRGEAGLEAVLDGAVGDGDGQVRLAGATGPAGDQAKALGDELGPEDAAEQSQADAGLEGEVELLDGLQEGEAGAPHAALDPGLGAVGDLFGHEAGQELAVGQPVLLGPLCQFRIEPAHCRQVEPPEQGVQVDRWRRHRAPSPTLTRGISR
jgi:hypothetical protein